MGMERPGDTLPAAAVQAHGPEERCSSKEWGLLVSICNSRLYFNSHSIVSIAESKTDEICSHTNCMTFAGW